MNRLFASGGQSIGVSASTSVLPMNTQDWSPLGWTGWICLQSKGLSGVFSSTTVLQCSAFFMVQLSHPYMTEKNVYNFDNTDLCWQSDVSAFNMLSRLVIAFLPRSKCLLISWLQSPSTVILEPKRRKSAILSTFSYSICHEEMGPDAIILVFWVEF